MGRRTAMTQRSGWRRLSPPGRKLQAEWMHDASGWVVKHCGHPTALHPYYAESPGHWPMVVSQNGHAFDTLQLACEGVESVISGACGLVEMEARQHGVVLCVRPAEQLGLVPVEDAHG